MKKIVISVVIFLAILIVSFYAFNAYIYQVKQGENIPDQAQVIEEKPAQDETPTISRFNAPEWGVEFSYPSGDNGYVLEKGSSDMSVDPQFLGSYMLTLRTDIDDINNSAIPREGAPTIQLRVYNNTQKQSPSVWAMNHPLESNIELAISEHREAVIGGANADTYKADGLYASDVYVVANDTLVYVFTGAYADQNSRIVSDYSELLNSIKFTAPPVVEQADNSPEQSKAYMNPYQNRKVVDPPVTE